MSNVWSLDSMREELEKEYAPMPLNIGGGEQVVLRSLLRMDKQDRDEVVARMSGMETENEDEDQDEDELLDAVHFVFRKVTAEGKGDKLVAALGNDLLLNMKVMREWQEATQPGEAQDSPS